MARSSKKTARKKSTAGASKDSLAASSKRRYLKQADVPSASLDEALRVPESILDHYAGESTAPLHVAKALNVDPKGSQLKVLSGAAIAFGLIQGGAQATAIEITDLARQILRPKEEGATQTARGEAVLKPRVFGEFLQKYDGHPFPREDIAQNVLEDMGVPRDRTLDVLSRIESSAEAVGFLVEIKGKRYVSLKDGGQHEGVADTPEPDIEPSEPEGELPKETKHGSSSLVAPTPPERSRKAPTEMAAAIQGDERRRRVFITHGRNRGLVDPIKKLRLFRLPCGLS